MSYFPVGRAPQARRGVGGLLDLFTGGSAAPTQPSWMDTTTTTAPPSSGGGFDLNALLGATKPGAQISPNIPRAGAAPSSGGSSWLDALTAGLATVNNITKPKGPAYAAPPPSSGMGIMPLVLIGGVGVLAILLLTRKKAA